jgi:hypothetical protein
MDESIDVKDTAQLAVFVRGTNIKLNGNEKDHYTFRFI